MNPSEDVVNIVGLAKEAEIFINTNLGKYLQERMATKVELAKDKLATVDPNDVNEILRQQNVISQFADFKQWIFDIVQAGELAYEDYLSEGE